MDGIHLQALLAYLCGPAFATLFAIMVVDFFRNTKWKVWLDLDPAFKQLVIATITIVIPIAIVNLVKGIPVETLKAADIYFYPISMILGRIYFVYRQGQDIKTQTPVEDKLLKDFFNEVIPVKDS